ncbi:MAG: iron ABC transporter permease [Planctomycetes bacterium]|nr:iron ABC transporter permease [Planctomycetota bacterium]
MRRAFSIGALLALALAACSVASLCLGSFGTSSPLEAARALLAWVGVLDESSRAFVIEQRLFRTLTAIGVGASLALSGALMQGVFRNPLASPDILGVSAGASLGAAVAILSLGGYASGLVMEGGFGRAALVNASAFAGALATLALVAALARGGGLSVPGLLLIGVAVNSLLTGVLTALQSFVLEDTGITRAMLAWGFGTLVDRSAEHALLVGLALLPALLATPFVARELDLLGGGEEDAAALGVDVARVQRRSLGAAALAASGAVAVAGQIAFVGLLVPHALRLLVGSAHRTLLPLSALGGAVLLLATDCLQRALFGVERIPPGVVMALLGGPLFVVLLLRSRPALRSW